MRRGGWRGILVVILAMAMVWALAPASVAGKGGNKSQKSEPGVTVEALDVNRDDPFLWINAVGDTIRFVVDVGWAESGTVIWATRGATGEADGVSFPYEMEFVVTEANLLVSETDPSAQAGTVAERLVFHFNVESGDRLGVATVELDVLRIDPATGIPPGTGITSAYLMKDCSEVGLEGNSDGTSYWTADQSGLAEMCIWHAPTPGTWTVELTPGPDETKRSAYVFVNLRDHSPGSRCTTPGEDLPSGRVQVGETLEGMVYIPADGYCLTGLNRTHGFAVGTLHDYVLYSPGGLTLELLPEEGA